jgi:DNA-binding PadR family transcriptional regulator
VAPRQLTDFEQVLLGLVYAAPSTGYDLKHEFAATPLGVYQPSSGAIYPALRRLERRSLLRAQQWLPPDTNGRPGRARRRVIYSITDQGRAAHAAWVRQPVNPATIATDLPLHLMRFVMMEPLVSRAEVLAFLAELRDALAAELEGLERFTAAAAAGMPNRHAPLALDHGVSVKVASLAWVKRTINALAGPEAWLSPGPERPSRPAETIRPGAPSR